MATVVVSRPKTDRPSFVVITAKRGSACAYPVTTASHMGVIELPIGPFQSHGDRPLLVVPVGSLRQTVASDSRASPVLTQKVVPLPILSVSCYPPQPALCTSS